MLFGGPCYQMHDALLECIELLPLCIAKAPFIFYPGIQNDTGRELIAKIRFRIALKP